MPVKTFGIYLAYPPTVDLRAEGLGRHLSEFLKGARHRGDVRFVIACPSWMRQNLIELFDASGVAMDDFEIISPVDKPLLLTAHQHYVALKKKPKRREPGSGLRARLGRWKARVVRRLERRLAGTRSSVLLLAFGLAAVPLIASVLLLRAADKLATQARAWPRQLAALLSRSPTVREVDERINNPAAQPKHLSLAVRLFRSMEESEAALLRDLIAARTDVAAWYSPTAFWPQFNDIPAPRLMCVPDVVLTDFPVGFAPVGGDRFLDNFRKVEKAIEGGQYFVTYSEEIKWRTLVERYYVDPDSVWVVRHGANRLDDLIVVSGFRDNEAATDALCRDLFRTALLKAINYHDARIFGSNDVRFIFYASQFRPNKNVMSLLRAYAHLLKRRYIGHKLVLTGNPNGLPEVRQFIEEQHLQDDVLCLHGLSAQELAACYRLADLAVNPSLSEGGCPFTFAEALSVGTPAVMARIPVTEEVITDPQLQDLMLFDPYDWTDMADKIEWSLHNLALLRARQQPFYERLAQRSWRQVVDEYVDILEQISSQRRSNTCAHVAAW